jgi:formylglycine-generating enzyme required for sulfatase activity
MPPGQTCLDKAIGAFGTAWGKAKQSCAGGLVCPVPDGKGGMEMADCCESIVVPEATFTMGGKASEVDGLPANDGKSYQATVSTYALDRFEVTVGRFRKFVEAYDGLVAQGLLPEGAGTNVNVGIPPPGTGWQTAWNAELPKSKAGLGDPSASCTYTETPGANEEKPITCVNWYQAFAFCAWDGGRLPTEAEWEMAASNGSAQSVYPWGDSEPTDALAVFSADGCFQNDTCLSGPSAVGSKPLGANQLGHRDLAGNVREWVLDAAAPYPTAESKNYTNNQDLLYRLDRGGSFYDFADDLHAATRGEVNFPVSGLYFHGLRCARTPLHDPARLFSRRCYLPFL